MLTHPEFSPIAFQIGPLAIRWYGLMYLVAFAAFYFLGRARLKATAGGASHWQRTTGLDAKGLEDLLFWGALGVVLGGRLGYVIFYKPGYYLANPLEALAVWQGGMSFHGGLIGVSLALLWFARRRGIGYLKLMDFVAPLVPLGLAAGRMGNFINGELWGRATSGPWAMVFPQAGDGVARHASQLYQFALEGVLLFIVIWLFSQRAKAPGMVCGAFMLGYAVLRFIAEFAREPDNFLGLLALGLSMGQWLCLPMGALGLYLMITAKNRA
jgi:phosphatidylglycerol---prolipoprotein diacylglyceryl transferase